MLTKTNFNFTEKENLYDKVSHKRLLELLNDKETTVTDCKISSNAYGEYLFITLVKNDSAVVFYGLGYHHQREQYIYDWSFHNTDYADKSQSIPKAEAEKAIVERYNETKGYDKPAPRSERAELFSILSEIGDEDGVSSLLDDFGY